MIKNTIKILSWTLLAGLGISLFPILKSSKSDQPQHVIYKTSNTEYSIELKESFAKMRSITITDADDSTRSIKALYQNSKCIAIGLQNSNDKMRDLISVLDSIYLDTESKLADERWSENYNVHKSFWDQHMKVKHDTLFRRYGQTIGLSDLDHDGKIDLIELVGASPGSYEFLMRSKSDTSEFDQRIAGYLK